MQGDEDFAPFLIIEMANNRLVFFLAILFCPKKKHAQISALLLASEDVEVVAALGLGVVAQHLVEDAAHAHSGRLPARDGAAAHRHEAAPRRLLSIKLQNRRSQTMT